MTRATWTAAVGLLFFARPAWADEPAAVEPATPEQVRQTVERAIEYIQAESAQWLNTRGCAACHHVPMPLWAMSEAAEHGYAIDRQFLASTIEATVGSPQMLISSKLVPGPNDPPDPRPLGQGVRVQTAFMAVAARAYAGLEDRHRQTLQTIAEEIVKKQREDGSWEFFLSRPPINENQTTDGAWLIMALEREAGPDAPQLSEALAKARAWLNQATLPDNLQDKVFHILLALRAGSPPSEVQSTIDEVLALQQPDGLWRQNPEMPPDAFATGQTLYVLALAGLTTARPEIQRAIDRLVATQQEDGSWTMTSRSSPDGSPGSSKLLTPINTAAASWVTMGLSRLVPAAP